MVGEWVHKFQRESSREVSHAGERPWTAQHHFYPPASPRAVKQAEKEIGIKLPRDLQDFWALSDGALLFSVAEGAPWGWRILGTERHLEEQHKWRRRFFDHWLTHFLVVGELVSPAVALVWNGEGILALWPQGHAMRELKVAGSLAEVLALLDASDGGLWWAWA